MGKADIGRMMMMMMTDVHVEVEVAVDIQVNDLHPNHAKQVQLTKVTQETYGHVSVCRELWIFLMKVISHLKMQVQTKSRLCTPIVK